MGRTIKTRVLFVNLLIVLLATLTLSYSNYLLVLNSHKQTYKEFLMDLAYLEAGETKNFLDNRIAEVEGMSKSREVEDYHINYRDVALTKYFTKFSEDFSKISYIGKNGQEEVKVVNGAVSENLLDMSRDRYLREAMRNPNKVILAEAGHDAETGMPVMDMVMARHGYFGDEFIGAISASLPVSAIAKRIAENKVGKTGFASLIDKEGRVLYYPQEHRFLTKVDIIAKGKEAESLASGITGSKSGYGRAVIFGVDSLIACAPVGEAGWSILVILPYREFVTAPNDLMRMSVIFLIVLAVLVAIVVAKLIGDITDPILKLVTVVNSIAKGDFSKKAEAATGDEVGLLGRSFNKMVEDLKRTTVSRDELAEEVVERKRAEEKLRESEGKIRALFAQTFQFIGLMTVDGILIEANRAALEFSGSDNADVLNKPFWQGPWWAHSPELQEKIRQSVEKAAHGEFVRFEATHIDKDGVTHYIDFSLKPVNDETGRVAFLVPEGRDITELKQLEEDKRHHIQELEVFYKASIGREERILELKGEVERLKKESKK
ncbi:MAG: cache domain-containing protein [Candidatus Omnitrophota bacterium]